MSNQYSTIKTNVTSYVKLNGSDPTLLAIVDDAIAIAVYEIARSNKWPELLRVGQSLTLTNLITGFGIVILPQAFMMIERVRFLNHSPLQNWRLQDRTGLVPPAPIYGKPRAFQIVESSDTVIPNAILIEPYASVDIAQDKIQYDYYEVPTFYGVAPGSEGGTPSPTARIKSNMWDAEIEKRAIHFMQVYYDNVDVAKETWASMLSQMGKPQNQTQQ